MSDRQRIHLFIQGCVQGVGFRPFIYRLAHRHLLTGTIKNTNGGVFIDVQGDESDLLLFQQAIVAELPERAVIAELHVSKMPLHSFKGFEMIESHPNDSPELPLLPDTAICEKCLQELFDKDNRRHLYPFVHCISCGPRFSIISRLPFDRINTSMDKFPMCAACLCEYHNPDDRRFYSQTNCCPACGPKIILVDRNRNVLAMGNQAIQSVVDSLQQGRIVSIKNTGGHQILVDALNEEAVRLLRMRKKRAAKPFALLMPSIESVKEYVYLTQSAEQVLTSPAAPIVLLNKHSQKKLIAPSVAFDSPYFGMMLPHNAIQHLLLKDINHPLVATSGNLSGEPLCINDDEALIKLSPIADLFLLHNRQIVHPLDDSVVLLIDDRPMLIRRARGYIPYAVSLLHPFEDSRHVLLAAGGQLKNTFALARGKRIYLSQHIGNLDSASTCSSYEKSIKTWENLLFMTPASAAGDQHPDYYSTDYLQRRKISTDWIQHHKAHVWSGMIENQLEPPLLGIAWDGTGWGEDGTIWGGEIFLVNEQRMNRLASLYPFKLPGGEKAIREPRLSALALLHTIWGDQMPSEEKTWLDRVFKHDELPLITQALSKGINSPLCSSMGRLFDAVSALLGCCLVSQFEGQAAMALEAMAKEGKNGCLRYSLPLVKHESLWLMDWRPLIIELLKNIREGLDLAEIAFAFHSALTDSIVEMSRIAGLKRVLLTGGVMQNQHLAEEAIVKLRANGFIPYWHQHIPPNDGGIAIGQIGAALEAKKGFMNV